MSFDQDIADIRTRIAKAEADRDHWRIVGRQEKYMEAYFLVDALGLELDRARRQRVDSAWRVPEEALPPRAENLPVDAAGDRERLMKRLAITFAGHQYQYSHYRYDRLADAVSYARKQLSSPSASDAADSLPPARADQAPDEAQRGQMAAHGITFDKGVYHLGEYRYDRLADALDYAGVQKLAEAPRGALG